MNETETLVAKRPRLLSGVSLSSVNIPDNAPRYRTGVERILSLLDGKRSIAEIAEGDPLFSQEDVTNLVRSLDQVGLIDDDAEVLFQTGAEVILQIEELVESLCETSIYKNPFWQVCMAASQPGDLPEKLAVGMVIENWHFLFRESYFDAPILSYVPNTAVRLLLNEFFSEEYGHDEILLKALNFVGISREDMNDAIPLPETMGLCNSLAYWAHSDPIFFFTTLGLLEGQGGKQDSFIDACERSGLPEGLVGPLKTHADINLKSAHGNLTRAIFEAIPVLSEATVLRLRRQTHLFVDLYDEFYTAIWRYYTSDNPLIRRVSQL